MHAIKVAVAGCAGRMGSALVREILVTPGLVLTAASVSPRAASLETDVGTLVGERAMDLLPVRDLSQVAERFDVLIDFTNPSATMSHLASAMVHQKAMVIGTTGWDTASRLAIESASERIPIVWAPNMSVGINLLLMLLEKAAHIIGSEADIHLSEIHHRHKKDRPSGTLLQMEAMLRSVLGDQIIEHSCIRAGDAVGEHAARFALAGESLTLTHSVTDRAIFARGALKAARWLSNQKPGLYTMREVLDF